MSDARTWAMETARIIIDNDCLYKRTQGDPFFFSSGWASPVFIDCKKLISAPMRATRWSAWRWSAFQTPSPAATRLPATS